MQDRPTILDLLAAVRELLASEIVPALADQRLKYHALIAVNVLRIIEREIPTEEERLTAELASLAELCDFPRKAAPPAPDATGNETAGGRLAHDRSLADLRDRVLDANRELSERIRRGLADDGPWRERVLSHLRAVVEAKLRVDNPGELEDPPSSGRK
jgi:uncharacterized protein DUF6285